MAPDAPSAAELETNPVVQAAFAAAWADSLADDQALRHEEGGFIYYDPTTGDITVRRAMPGGMLYLNLDSPPTVPGSYLVATHHTHAFPAALGHDPSPSSDDFEEADGSGVPWFVVTELGVLVVGPDRRVGGLTGPPGYPIKGGAAMSATVMTPTVTRQQAILIAEADAVPLFGNDLNVLTLEAALHDDGWHVEYHMRRPRWAGGGPHYVIDADTGVIKSKKYYQ